MLKSNFEYQEDLIDENHKIDSSSVRSESKIEREVMKGDVVVTGENEEMTLHPEVVKKFYVGDKEVEGLEKASSSA